jgi:tetratricopeptide (TPR) repeat protein
MPARLVATFLLADVALATTPSAAGPIGTEIAQRRARILREGRHAEAAAALLGLDELIGFLPAGSLREVAELGTRRGNHPLVRGVAEELLVGMDLGRGDLDSARRRREQLGFVEAWQVIGPFADGDSLGRAEAVDGAPFDPSAHMAGKARPVGWRTLPDIVRTGYVPLDAVLRPEQDACAYATAAVRSPVRRAALRVGSAGPVRVWLGDDLVLERRVTRPPRPDQDAAAVVLDAGWNLFRVKTCVRDGAWGFYLRLTDPDGEPIKVGRSTDPAVLAGARGGGAGKHRVATLREALQRSAERARDDGAWRDLAAFHHYVSPEDPAGKDAEHAQEQAVAKGPTARNYVVLAAVQADADDRRRALEEAVRIDPVDSRALTALSRALLALGREDRVPGILDRAVRAAPAYLPARLAEAAWLSNSGFPLAAAERLRALHREFPDASRVAAQLADAERRADRPAQAAALLADYLRGAADDVSAWRDLAELRRGSGDLPGALDACERAIAARPDLSSSYVVKADLLAVVGRFEEAAQAVRAALAVVPEEPRLHERLGRLLHMAARDEEAVAELERSLDLGPQNPDLRAYLSSLRPRAPSPLDRYRRDPEEVLAAARSGARTADPQGAPATALWDLYAVEVQPGGQSRTLHQRIVQVHNDQGARDNAEFAIRYTPSRQQVDVREARVYRAGRVVATASRFDQDLSEPWYGLYYDYRALVLRMEGLRAGDVIEIEYLVEDNTPHNLLGDTFGDFVFLQESIPRADAEVVVVHPSAREIRTNDERRPWLVHTVEAQGDLTVQRFRMHDVPAVKDEPGMPGYSEVAAYLHVSTFRSWPEVADWYAALVRDQLKDDAAIRDAVAQAVAGLGDERARIRAVHNLAVRQTRYVGLEFGIHGYQPYRVPDVYARKFGDCKDKAALLVVMMRLIGVDAEMVLVRTRRGGDVADVPASLAIFDHAITYLPKYDLYLDGTAEFSGTEELPAQDQGVPVLRIAPGETLRRTPVLPPEASRVEVVLSGGLDGSGAARLRESLRLRGQAAADWRRHYQSPAQRRDRYEQAWNERHAGARLIDVDMPGVEDLEADVRVEADVQVPALGRKEGHVLQVPVAAREGEMVRTYARQSARRYDLVLDYPWTQEARLELDAPPGMTVGALPPARRIDGPFGQFELSVQRDGTRVLSRVRLRIAHNRVPAASYAEFRRFLLQVDEALGQKITFVGD